MTEKRALCLYNGQIQELSSTDTLIGFTQQHLWLGGVVNQTGHGFKLWHVLKINEAGRYALAKADNSVNAEVVGIVSKIIDENTFQITYSGQLDNFTGYNIGNVLFLSSVIEGEFTLEIPVYSGQVNKPLIIALPDSKGLFVNFRGIELREISGFNKTTYSQIFDVTDSNRRIYELAFSVMSNPDAAISLNGLILNYGISRDYIIVNNNIIFNDNAPLQTGDVIRVCL